MDWLAGALVVGVGLFLLAQGLLAAMRPDTVRRFLGAFASTPTAHFAELALRLLAGAAFVRFAPHTDWPVLFALFGYVLLVTTVVMLCVPWRLHRRFARWAVPLATRNMGLFALACAVAGASVLYGA